MIRRPPRSTRTDTLFPYTTLFRSFCAIFAVEFIWRWYRQGWQRTFLMRNWYEILGMIPAANPAIRAFRLFRIVRIIVMLSRVGSRSEEHTSEFQSLMRISYAVFCLKKKIYHKYNIY